MRGSDNMNNSIAQKPRRLKNNLGLFDWLTAIKPGRVGSGMGGIFRNSPNPMLESASISLAPGFHDEIRGFSATTIIHPDHGLAVF